MEGYFYARPLSSLLLEINPGIEIPLRFHQKALPKGTCCGHNKCSQLFRRVKNLRNSRCVMKCFFSA